MAASSYVAVLESPAGTRTVEVEARGHSAAHLAAQGLCGELEFVRGVLESSPKEATMRFTKVEAGWYATEDGCYAVIVDGYTGRDDDGGAEFGEWALAHDPAGGLRGSHQAGSNLDWFPTKRAAVEAAARR